MHGRMLHLPAPRGKTGPEILFVYGQHSTLERWWGLMLALNRYAAITMPDLPGHGGMDSFYKVGRKPTLDNLADYLAAFIKLRYKRKKVVIAGMSFGFLVATRMLQKYPELSSKVELLVSIVGFSHHDDFAFSPRRFRFFKYGSKFFALRIPAWIHQHIFLQPIFLRRVYSHTYNAQDKFAGKIGEDFEATMAMEIKLWRLNDIRTQYFCNGQMFTLDNCTSRIDLPLIHVTTEVDRYLDEYRVEEHLKVIFTDVKVAKSKLLAHAPTVIADAKTASALIPPQLKRALNRL